MKKKIILILIIAVFGLIVPVSATWIILTERQLTPAYNPTSGLTEYLAQQSANTIIYKETAYEANYPGIKYDVTYTTENTVNLGYYSDNSDYSFEIPHSVSFTHKDGIQQTYTDFVTPPNTNSGVPSDAQKQCLYEHFAVNTLINSNTINYSYEKINYSQSIATRYTVKLVGNVTIGKGNYLSLGSVICSSGSGQGRSGGVIVSDHVDLDLNGHILTVESGATLYAYGYIFDSTAGGPSGDILQGTRTYDYGKGKIINRGTIYSPYVVENYSGNGRTVATALAQTVPFTLYSIPYLGCVTEFYYGSSLLCPTALYANNTYHTTMINFIGSSSDALIQLQSGASVIRKGYNPRTTNIQTFCQQYRAQYAINGKININTLSLKVTMGIEVEVNLAEYHFPIPPYADIILNETAEVTLPLQLDFFPGSTLYCETNSTIILSSTSVTSIRKGKWNSSITVNSLGGINMLTQMTADSSNCYAGLSYTLSYYSQYEQAEAALYNPAGSAKARATINGNITTDSQAGHVLSGKINLSENTKNNLDVSKFNFINRSYQEYHEISSGDLVKLVANIVTNGLDCTGEGIVGGYHILPLVSNGRVVGDIVNNNFSAITGDNVTYDFNEGVYTNVSNGAKYGYIPDDINSAGTNGSIKQITHNSTNHTVTYNNTAYIFFRNCFVPIISYNPNKTIYSSQGYEVSFNNETATVKYNYTGTLTTNVSTTPTWTHSVIKSYAIFSQYPSNNTTVNLITNAPVNTKKFQLETLKINLGQMTLTYKPLITTYTDTVSFYFNDITRLKYNSTLNYWQKQTAIIK